MKIYCLVTFGFVLLSTCVDARIASLERSEELPQSETLSVNFQDISVRRVLQQIADYNDFNLVVSDAVTGNMTLRLKNVPWSQLLDIILHVEGLEKHIKGNVLIVAPAAEIAQLQQQEQDAMLSELLPLNSEMVPLRFAKAADIAAILGKQEETSMLSERGSMSIDSRTNSLLIRDVVSNIQAIKSIIEELDVPVKQVQIEARIVSFNEGDLQELGVLWGGGNRSVEEVREGNLAGLQLYGDSGVSLDDLLRTNINNTSLSTTAFQVAKLGSETLLDLELSALQRESRAEVISSPRLITTNKQPAYIEQGTDIPYLEASSSGATSVSFKKAVLSLKVTPHITVDNRLILDLNVTQDRPGEVVKTGTGEAVAIDRQRIGTQVLVNNGETIVLGGIYQHSMTDTVDQVPVLGDIPVLGALFRRNYQKMRKSELLIFVTPKVVVPESINR
ncbi:type IV pilus secretin PilQ [Vibrio neptunius]|uniref:Type IV pilus secretin PilQ n=1 Tax=Vibrio neptunius TaxID=170651 RepID=A0ABS3A623_9VIBR|nr:type IV pilus secretin PilQ [Vibrio neptunius]MBN3495146.1 type IV pilus secretin PilQ [Vibrio neptunius]MBN3517596.1 type IV pilus secretin PilQ [Vibrio neptunius]MBN3551953.1 type IV pilus secretin PilQ [Vibrio neptunius]MBN3579941.1 type IV pilus secretin PilQ [Vibrio neptunius]MCH9873607.1 type IV pilus secretin PilQ [Vibrio neptunius]